MHRSVFQGRAVLDC